MVMGITKLHLHALTQHEILQDLGKPHDNPLEEFKRRWNEYYRETENLHWDNNPLIYQFEITPLTSPTEQGLLIIIAAMDKYIHKLQDKVDYLYNAAQYMDFNPKEYNERFP
jgi:hypothetical protein